MKGGIRARLGKTKGEMQKVATLGVINKSKSKVKYKAKNEKQMEAREAKVQELGNMGKEMVGEELRFDDIGSIQAFVMG
jgi:hypothetical protein